MASCRKCIQVSHQACKCDPGGKFSFDLSQLRLILLFLHILAPGIYEYVCFLGRLVSSRSTLFLNVKTVCILIFGQTGAYV